MTKFVVFMTYARELADLNISFNTYLSFFRYLDRSSFKLAQRAFYR